MTKARDLANVATNATDAANAIPDTLVDAKGDLIVASAADTVLRLGVGTNDHVLTADSSTTSGVKWAALPSSGGMTLISTITASSATGVSFTSIPTTYKQLMVVFQNVYQSSDTTYFYVRLNNDSNNNYLNGHIFASTGSSTQINSGQWTDSSFGASDYQSPIPRGSNSPASPVQHTRGVFTIYNADQTTPNKLASWKSLGYSTSLSTMRGPLSAFGVYTGTSAISQIDFIRNSTQTIDGEFRLYGVQ